MKPACWRKAKAEDRASICWTMDFSIANWRATWTSWSCTAAIFSQRLLPAGRLREPLSSLRRADVIVLRHEDADLESQLRVHLQPGMPLLAGAAHRFAAQPCAASRSLLRDRAAG